MRKRFGKKDQTFRGDERTVGDFGEDLVDITLQPIDKDVFSAQTLPGLLDNCRARSRSVEGF